MLVIKRLAGSYRLEVKHKQRGCEFYSRVFNYAGKLASVGSCKEDFGTVLVAIKDLRLRHNASNYLPTN